MEKTINKYREDGISVLGRLTNEEFMQDMYELLSEDEGYQAAFKRIEKAASSLPIEIVNEIESAYCLQLAITQETMYRKGFRDGVNLILELAGCKSLNAARRPEYMCIELESRRKDAARKYPGMKSGTIYKLIRVIKEYTSETEADRDMEALLSGRITEADIVLRGART